MSENSVAMFGKIILIIAFLFQSSNDLKRVEPESMYKPTFFHQILVDFSFCSVKFGSLFCFCLTFYSQNIAPFFLPSVKKESLFGKVAEVVRD